MSKPSRKRQPTSQPTFTLEILAEKFIHHLQVRNFAASTIEMRRVYLRRFLAWCDDRGIERTSTSVLFVSRNRRPFGASNLSILVRDYITSAGITKPGSCHLFRHTVATQMLENGADIRSLQALLGHSEITTTQIYMHVSIKRLKDVHRATHPADIPRPKEPEDENAGDSA